MALDKEGFAEIPVMVAKRNIAPEEEILFNYGTDKPYLGDTTATLKRKGKTPMGP